MASVEVQFWRKKNPPETQPEFSTKNGDECCVKKTMNIGKKSIKMTTAMETGNFSPVMVVGHDGHGHHGPP